LCESGSGTLPELAHPAHTASSAQFLGSYGTQNKSPRINLGMKLNTVAGLGFALAANVPIIDRRRTHAGFNNSGSVSQRTSYDD
jgi:hypothetical protein